MTELIMSLAVFMLLFTLSMSAIVLLNYFFPSTKQMLPEGWSRWLTFRAITYYVLITVVLLLMGTS